MRDSILLLILGVLYLTASSTEPRPETDAIRGTATWYDDGPGLYGAVHSYRWGDPRYTVKVCRADNHSVCVTVTVRDHMANPRRVIDLSPDAFRRLAPLSRGVVQVVVDQPTIPLPATDTEVGG